MTPLNPTSFSWELRYKEPSEQAIEAALKQGLLETAKNLAFERHGLWSLETQKWLQLIIEKILYLNDSPIAPVAEYKKINYTFDTARKLGMHIYFASFRNKSNQEAILSIATEALSKVAEAYSKKNNYLEACETLNSFENLKAFMPEIFPKWKYFRW